MTDLGRFHLERHHKTKKINEYEISAKLDSKGIPHYIWSNRGGDQYSAHSHPYKKIIWVIRGEITFILTESNKEIRLVEGDRIELPAKVVHEASVGSMGVACLEAQLLELV